MVSHTFIRNCLTAFHADIIFCLALSAPIPALSKSVPMTELFPRINWMKSSITSNKIATTAMIARTFNLARIMALFTALKASDNAFSLAMIFTFAMAATETAANAAITDPNIRNTFSKPPSFSAIRVTVPIALSIPETSALKTFPPTLESASANDFHTVIDRVTAVLIDCPSRSIEGCNFLTRAWIRSNA